MNKKYFFSLYAIFLVCIIHVGLKYYVFRSSLAGHPNPFTMESAFYYRYVILTDKGEPIPKPDTKMQMPDGIDVVREESYGMEWVLGMTHRIWPFRTISLENYVRFFVLFSSVPIIIAVYIWASGLYRSSLAGLLGACLYGFSWAVILRTIGQSLIREYFALPFFAFHMVAFSSSLRLMDTMRKGLVKILSHLSGGMLAIALATWQFAQFYLALLAVFSFIAVTFEDKARLRVKQVLGVCVVWCLAAGLLVPYLQKTNFVSSMPFLLLFSSWIVHMIWDKLHPARRVFITAGCVAAALVIGISGAHGYDYSHVYEIFLAKAHFLGHKPEDPALLSFDTRLVWVMPCLSPTILGWLDGMAVLTLVALVPAVFLLRKIAMRQGVPEEKYLFILLLGTCFWYLIAVRWGVFFVIPLSVIAGGCPANFLKKHMKYLVAFVILFLVLSDVARIAQKRVAVTSRGQADLLQWITLNTPEGAVILAPFHVSPQIIAYTDRAIVLHPKIETFQMRDRIRRWMETLIVPSEEPLYLFARQHEATHLVWPRGTYLVEGGLGTRYMAGTRNFSKRDVGYLLEAIPDQSVTVENGRWMMKVETFPRQPPLKHFQLVYTNREFCVYEICSSKHPDLK